MSRLPAGSPRLRPCGTFAAWVSPFRSSWGWLPPGQPPEGQGSGVPSPRLTDSDRGRALAHLPPVPVAGSRREHQPPGPREAEVDEDGEEGHHRPADEHEHVVALGEAVDHVAPQASPPDDRT